MKGTRPIAPVRPALIAAALALVLVGCGGERSPAVPDVASACKSLARDVFTRTEFPTARVSGAFRTDVSGLEAAELRMFGINDEKPYGNHLPGDPAILCYLDADLSSVETSRVIAGYVPGPNPTWRFIRYGSPATLPVLPP